MSKMFKKVIAAASATAITLSVVAPVTSVSADTASVDAANALAANGVINDNSSNPAAYKLDSDITRREMAKVMMNLSGLEVSDSCEGKFSDLQAGDWGCKYAEAALANGFVAANASFNADANISKWESLKFILKAKGFEKAEGVEPFQKAYVQAALDNGLISAEFTDYNTPAVRGFIFSTAANTIVEDDTVDSDDDFGLDFGDFDIDFGDDTDTDTTMDDDTNADSDTDTTAPVVSIDEDMVQVELSPMSPSNGERVPTETPRVTMMVLDLTAGTDDVELTNIKLESAGFGDSANINNVVLYNQAGEKVTRQRSVNSDDEVELDFINEFTVKAGETVSLTVSAQIDDAENGNVYALNVVELEGTSDVDGAPVEGPELEGVAISNKGIMEIDQNDPSSDVKVGVESKLAGLKVKNENDKEDILLKTIRLEQIGSIDEDYIADLYVKVDGKKVDMDLDFAKEYLTLNFGDGYVLEKERSSFINVDLYGTITGEPTKTVGFQITDADDVYAIGKKTGYNTAVEYDNDDFDGGLVVTNDTGDSDDDDYGILTVEGSAIEVSFEKGTKDASNKDVDDFNFGTLKLTSTTSDYTLEDYAITLTVTRSGGPNVAEGDLLENIKLGRYSTDSTMTLTPDTTEEFEINFEDITLNKGTTLVLPLTADIPDTATVDAVSYEFDLSFDSFRLKDEDNNESYTASGSQYKDIFSTYSGLESRNVDVEGATLTFTGDTIDSEEIVLGNSTITLFRGDVEAGSAANVKINEISFTNDSGTPAPLDEVISKAFLTIGSETYESTDIETTTINFDSLAHVVEAGSNNREEIKLDVQFRKADDSVIAINNEIELIIASANDVEAEDVDTGDVVAADVDDVDTESMTATLSTTGDLVVDMDIERDDAHTDLFHEDRFVLAGTNSYKLAKLDLEADKEDMKVEELVFISADDNAVDAKESIDNVRLFRGNTEVANATVSVNDDDELVLTFDNIQNVTVTDEEETFYVVADIKKINLESGKATAFSGATFTVELDSAEFQGVSSSDTLELGDVTVNEDTAETVTVIASDVAAVEVNKGTATLANEQFVAVAEIVATAASNNNKESDGKTDIKALLSQVTLNKNDFTFNFTGTAADQSATATITVDDVDLIDAENEVNEVTVGGTIEAGDKFTVTLDATPYTVAATDISANTTAGLLATAINGNDGFTATASGSVVTISKAADYTIATTTVESNDDATDGQTISDSETNAYVAGENPASANIVVDGDNIAVDIETGATTSEVAAAIASAIDADGSYSATSNGSVVTVTHGTVGFEEDGSTIDTTALEAAINAADASSDDATLTATDFEGGAYAYEVRLRNKDTNEIISTSYEFDGSTAITAIDDIVADEDSLEINSSTTFEVEVKVNADNIEDSSYSIRIDREDVVFTDGVAAGSTAGGTDVTTFNKIYRSGATVAK